MITVKDNNKQKFSITSRRLSEVLGKKNRVHRFILLSDLKKLLKEADSNVAGTILCPYKSRTWVPASYSVFYYPNIKLLKIGCKQFSGRSFLKIMKALKLK